MDRILFYCHIVGFVNSSSREKRDEKIAVDRYAGRFIHFFFSGSKNVEGILDIRLAHVVTVAGAVRIRRFVR